MPTCEKKAVLWALVDQLVGCKLGEFVTDSSVIFLFPYLVQLFSKKRLICRLCAACSIMTHTHAQERREKRGELKESYSVKSSLIAKLGNKILRSSLLHAFNV